MKRIALMLAVICALALAAEEKVIVSLTNLIDEAVNSSVFTEITFPDESTLCLSTADGDRTYAVDDISSITFEEGGDVVTVTYDGTTAHVYNPMAFYGVEVSVDGAHVTVNSTTSQEVKYRLAGSTTDGSFKIYGVVKYELTLDGVDITNPQGAAINSQCKKKMTLVLADGTVNTLADGTKYNTPSGEDEKGCIFSEGQIEVNGAGELRVEGNKKHAVCTDDEFQMKTGTLVVTKAASDGIHSKDAFKMNGGTIEVSGTASDCIDGDEGIVTIKGGVINVTAAEADTKAIACDSTLTVNGGEVNVILTGDQSKGLKSKQNILINAGKLIFTCSGNAVDTGGDMSYCTAVKSDINIVMTGGEVSITHTGEGGKGFSADGDVEVSGGTIEATMSGDGGSYTTTDNATDTYCSHAITCDGNMNLLAGTITLNVSGASAKGLNSDGTIVIGSKEETEDAAECKIVVTASSSDSKAISSDENLTVNNGTINITLTGDQSKGLKSKKDIYINGGDLTFNCSGNAVNESGDMSFCTAIKSDGSIYVNDGDIDITHTGTGGKGLSGDIDVEVTGGTIKATMSGNGGTYTTSTNTTDTYSSHAIKSDGNMRLLGGTLTLSASGQAGKCIKSDGTLNIGDEEGNGPVISASTSGAKIGSTSNTRPGPGGWGDQGNSATSSAKAIKCQGAFVMNGGDVTVTTETDGAEGIESKTSMDFNGGSVYIKAYDDAINSAGIIKLAGANVYAWSTGNDAIDSNALTSGAITVSGGVVIAVSSAGGAECGLDCDNAAVVVSGGYLFSLSGSQSNTGGFGGFGGGGGASSSVPTSSTAIQPTALASSLSLTQNNYMCVRDSSGNLLFAVEVPYSCSSGTSLVSCPEFVKGSTYTIGVSTGAPTGSTSEWNGVYVGGSVSSCTTSKTITFSSNYVSI